MTHRVTVDSRIVEGGEIERALIEHPAVREAVVASVQPGLDTRPDTLAGALAFLSDADAEVLLLQAEAAT